MFEMVQKLYVSTMVGIIIERTLFFGIFSLIINEAANIEQDDELVTVALVFRHGDRAPLGSFPNDEHFNETNWPMGVGHLLKAGKNRSYELGKYLRQRYKTFLSDQYRPEEIYVISSDVDRTLMSAELVLAGLYPPIKEDVWLEDLPWQPIPVRSVQDKHDNFIAIVAECPNLDLLKGVAQTEVSGTLRNRFPDIFETVSQYSGWSEVDIENLKKLIATMAIYENHKPSFVPDWYKELDQNSLSYIAGVYFALPTYTKQLQRLSTGPLYNYLLNHLDGSIKGEKPKFLMISGHDLTIVPMLDTIDCFDYKIPDVTASVFWEVYRTASGQYYIKLLYKKGPQSGAEPILVDGCRNSWGYDEFKTYIAPVQTSDEEWSRECSIETMKGGSGRLEASFILISSIFFCLNIYY